MPAITLFHLFLYLSSLSTLVLGQFQFFENMFHHGHQQQQRPSGASQWAAYSESVQCSQYLCPATLDCVKAPVDCPCPHPEDIKCLIPEVDGSGDGGATVLCVSGQSQCAEVERLAGLGGQK